jgi:two-component system cell cycle response regulator
LVNQAEPEAGGTRFLIVEDDQDYSAYLALVVEQSYPGGCIIDVVSSVPDALRRLTDQAYDVCFLDYYLEPYTGLDVLRTMAFRDTPTAFVFLTSNDHREAAAEALHFGAMDYLVKAHFQPFDLIKAVTFAQYRKQRETELRHISLRDPLTGLGNRALFDEQLRTTLARAQRNKERLGVAVIDLDDFKPVNDTHGHQAGDVVLRDIAHRLLDQLRRSDVTARIGGDEFAALLIDVAEGPALADVGNKIKTAIAGTPYDVAGTRVRVGASVGIAAFPEDGHEPELLVRLADTRMYADKKAHKGGR